MLLWIDLLKKCISVVKSLKNRKYHLICSVLYHYVDDSFLHTPRTFGSSSLTMPAIMYDGSEEELMNTIEKEFNWPPAESAAAKLFSLSAVLVAQKSLH